MTDCIAHTIRAACLRRVAPRERTWPRHWQRLEVLLDDLTVATDAEFASRGLDLFATVAAVFLRDARDPTRVIPALERMAATLAALRRAPDGARALARSPAKRLTSPPVARDNCPRS